MSEEDIYVRWDGRVEKRISYVFKLFPSVMDKVIETLKIFLKEMSTIDPKDNPLITLDLQNISEFIDEYHKFLSERK